MAIQVTNSSSALSGKTLLDAEDNQTITGVKTFDLDPSAPFVVTASSAVVTNLDADKVDGKHSTALVLVDGTQAMTGTLDLGTIGQVQFPAAQNASANANCLDDYEEGTWTPVIGGSGGTSGQTYGLQAGRYVKIGKLVMAWANVALTVKGTITGNVEIQGLPFTIENLTNQAVPLGITFWTGMASSFVFLGGFGILNTTTASVRGATAAGTALSQLTTADLNNSAQFVLAITYTASN